MATNTQIEITVFAKKRKNSQGATFYGYLATLDNKKTGESETVGVRFREEAGKPEPADCPMNIVFERKDGNISSREYTDEATGQKRIAKTLWLTSWAVGSEYVDTSLDEFF